MTRALHQLCTIFPRLEGDDFAALVADIAANGLREPIMLLGEDVLDGGNRYRACIEAGVDPQFVQFTGTDPVSYVLSKNLHRRHLKPGQMAIIVASATDWTKAQRHGGDRKSDQEPISVLDRVADRVAASGASINTQKMADKVAREAPELAEKVAHGEISLNAAHSALTQKPSAHDSVGGKQEGAPVAAVHSPSPDASASDHVPHSDDDEEATAAGSAPPPADPRDARIAALEDQIAELAKNLEEALADNASMAKVFDANDKLAVALAEAKQARDQARLLNERITGLMNEKNQYVRLTKHWKGLHDKLEKTLKVAA